MLPQPFAQGFATLRRLSLRLCRPWSRRSRRPQFPRSKWWQLRYYLWLGLLSLGLTFTVLPTLTTATIPPPAAQTELRGVWLTNVDSEVLFSREKAAEAIATLGQLNFNTLFPTVWNWGYTLYPSPVAQQATGRSLDPEPGLQGRDMLQEVTEQARLHQMQVLPWFEFGFMAPADSQLAQQHPDWLTKRQSGDTIWWEGDRHQRVWLNPLHPEVQRLIIDLSVEIVSRYDVDGIQFDDHMGYPSDFGYDELTLQLYQAEHQGQSPPSDSQDPDWVKWRADKITQFMQRLSDAIRAANPQAIISLSPNPQEFSINVFLLDWQRWYQLELVDEIVLQVYRKHQEDFLRELSQPSVQVAKQVVPFSIGILSGLKDQPAPMERILTQAKTVREQQFAGMSFFFYESLWNLSAEPQQTRQRAFQSLFPQPISPPTPSLACQTILNRGALASQIPSVPCPNLS